jgi:hypothetical protein
MAIASIKRESILHPWKTCIVKKKSSFYVHNNHVEIRCEDWETELSTEIERLNHFQGNHVNTFYIHNTHRWSNFFALLHATTWIWIEMERLFFCVAASWLLWNLKPIMKLIIPININIVLHVRPNIFNSYFSQLPNMLGQHD